MPGLLQSPLMKQANINNTTAVILAGGQGRRMGGKDKGLIEFNGRPIIELLIERLAQQQVDIVINANRNQSVYRQYGFPVISDELDNFQGPLAGFAACMRSLTNGYILTLPCDGPFLCDALVELFIAAQQQSGAPICVADDGERLQPVYALIDTELLPSLEKFLASGDRKIDRWYTEHQFTRVDFSSFKTMFGNINKPEDFAALSEKALP